MKKATIPFLLCFILFSALISHAQSGLTTYKKLDYVNVNPNYLDQFLTLIDNDFKSDMDSIEGPDDIKSWSLYKVQYPGGERSGYNFIIVATASSMSVFEKHYSEISTTEFLPKEVGSKTQQQFDNLCSLVKSELWKVENQLPNPDNSSTPSRYMTMDYMKVAPGKSFDYLMLEDEIAKPIHSKRIEKNHMQGWQVYSLVLPGGTNYGYNFATGNFFDQMGHIEFGFTKEIINQTMGDDSNIPELFKTIYSTRELVKTEMWELVDHEE